MLGAILKGIQELKNRRLKKKLIYLFILKVLIKGIPTSKTKPKLNPLNVPRGTF